MLDGREAMRLSVSLREGSDSAVLDQLGGDRHFNPRSREGSDAGKALGLPQDKQFQSTLP